MLRDGENHNSGYPSFIATYTYDHNGNRLTKTQNGQVDTYHYQAHMDILLSVTGGISGTRNYSYDQNGVVRSLTSNGTTLYLTPDAEDRYTRFDFNTGPGQGSVYATEGYNGLGLRVFRHDANGLNHTLAYGGVSPGDALLSDSNNGTLFTPGLAQQDSTSGQHFWQVDALGSARGYSGNNQAAQGEIYYDAFGLPGVHLGQVPTPLGFAGSAGYQTDTDTGLMLLGNRYYDPIIGRFLSPDPSGSGDNWYAYCDNDPLSYTDPTGLDWQDDAAAGDPNHHGEKTHRDSDGILHWTDGQGNDISYAQNADGDFTRFVDEPAPRSDGPPGYGDAFTSGLGVGLSAIASAFSGGLYNGGSARSDPTFNVSRNLATVAAIAIPGGGEENLAARGAQTVITHWNTAEKIAEISSNGLRSGSWVMKGGPNRIKWILTGKFLDYAYDSHITLSVPATTVTRNGVDLLQMLLRHFRYWP